MSSIGSGTQSGGTKGQQPQGLNPRSEDVPLNRLLEPKLASRDTMDEAKMHELIESIRAMGILQPLVVEEEAGYFRIHAGHRRFTAASALELPTVPCRIYQAGTIPRLAAQAHENAIREDLNPAEEALWFQQLYETECDQDTNILAEAVKRPRAFVEQRLLLVSGDAEVFEALKLGQIGVTAAEELNKFRDRGTRRMFLITAIQGGAKASQIKQWRQQYEAALAQVGDIPPGAAVEGAEGQPRFENEMRCLVCGKTTEAYSFIVVWIHGPCKSLVIDPYLDRLAGGEG